MANPDDVLNRIEAQSKERYMPIIGPQRGRILDEVVKKYAPKNVLEVGTFVGYSAIRMARLLPRSAHVTCLDRDEEAARAARRNIAEAGLADIVDVKVGDAKELIPLLDGSFDMVFLDARKDEYILYLSLVEKKLARRAVLVADNVKTFSGEMAEYLHRVRDSGLYSSSYREEGGDALEISVRRVVDS